MNLTVSLAIVAAALIGGLSFWVWKPLPKIGLPPSHPSVQTTDAGNTAGGSSDIDATVNAALNTEFSGDSSDASADTANANSGVGSQNSSITNVSNASYDPGY